MTPHSRQPTRRAVVSTHQLYFTHDAARVEDREPGESEHHDVD